MLASGELALQFGQRQVFEPRKEFEQLRDRDRSRFAQLVGEWVIGHRNHSERLAAVVQAHPVLSRVATIATDPVSLVGGVVRDTILDTPFGPDIDLVVEGDAIAFAQHIGRVLSVRVVTHPRFGTAELQMPHGPPIDVTMARSETYPAPGVLPDVRPGTLLDDLARRDFTVNAIAYRLSGDTAGELVDPFDGCADIDTGILRILHPASFVDDPSRLVRLARYAARFAFRSDSATTAAARTAALTLDGSSPRVGDELRRLLHDSTAAAATQLMRALGVRWILPSVTSAAALFDAVDRALRATGAPRVEAWAIRLGLVVDADALATVAVDGWARGVAHEVADATALTVALEGASTRSEVDRLLMRARPATVVVALASGAEVIRNWWATDRQLRLTIGGDDLVASGLSPGPHLGSALAATRRAVLDGELGALRDDQLAYALRYIEEQ